MIYALCSMLYALCFIWLSFKAVSKSMKILRKYVKEQRRLMLYWNNAKNAHARPQKPAWARLPARKSLPAQARPQKLALACLRTLVCAC
jgi:hypothetical protein